MAYLTNADVAAYLGETLTTPQQAHFDALIPAVEAASNAYANRRWSVYDARLMATSGSIFQVSTRSAASLPLPWTALR